MGLRVRMREDKREVRQETSDRREKSKLKKKRKK